LGANQQKALKFHRISSNEDFYYSVDAVCLPGPCISGGQGVQDTAYPGRVPGVQEVHGKDGRQGDLLQDQPVPVFRLLRRQRQPGGVRPDRPLQGEAALGRGLGLMADKKGLHPV